MFDSLHLLALDFIEWLAILAAAGIGAGIAMLVWSIIQARMWPNKDCGHGKKAYEILAAILKVTNNPVALAPEPQRSGINARCQMIMLFPSAPPNACTHLDSALTHCQAGDWDLAIQELDQIF